MEQEKMYHTIEKELVCRHWGIQAKGKSQGKRPRFYIMDYRGLGLATGIIRYTYHINEPNTKIFYRGQRREWEIRPSLYRNCHNRNDIKRVEVWLERALISITEKFDPEGTDDEREALLQHYGLKTRFLDVVDNVQSALWFAYDDISKENCRYDDSVGYIQVLALPEGSAQVLDLRNKPSEWLRPHIQQGFAVKRNQPSSSLGSFSRHLVATFIVPRENLRLWSNYDHLPHDYFYPSAAVDRGMQYWEKAREQLKADGLTDSI